MITAAGKIAGETLILQKDLGSDVLNRICKLKKDVITTDMTVVSSNRCASNSNLLINTDYNSRSFSID